MIDWGKSNQAQSQSQQIQSQTNQQTSQALPTLPKPTIETLPAPNIEIPTIESEEIVEERDIKEIEKEIESSGFTEISKIVKKLPMRILVTGRPGVGKTHFSLTAPAPIAIIDTEFAVPTIAPKFLNKKIYWTKCLDVNKKTNEIDAYLIFEKLKFQLTKIDEMVQQGLIQTVVFDSVTSLWKYAQFWLIYDVKRRGGKINLKGVPADRRDWGRANSLYEGIINRLNALGVNVIYTAQSQPVYDEQGRLTGEYKPSYQKSTPFLVDVIINLYTRVAPDGKIKYYGTIEKCRFPVEGVVGTEIEDPSFDKVKSLIMEGLKKYFS